MVNIKHVLCPVDFSEFSRHAFGRAVAVARGYGADLTVLHVLPVPSAVPALPYGPEGPGPFGFEAVDRERALAELSRFFATGHSDWCSCPLRNRRIAVGSQGDPPADVQDVGGSRGDGHARTLRLRSPVPWLRRREDPAHLPRAGARRPAAHAGCRPCAHRAVPQCAVRGRLLAGLGTRARTCGVARPSRSRAAHAAARRGTDAGRLRPDGRAAVRHRRLRIPPRGIRPGAIAEAGTGPR